jgi:hypothetical protein
MNEERQKKLREITDKLVIIETEISDLYSEEEEALDNLPEHLQEAEVAEKIRVAMFNLESVWSSIVSCREYLDEILSKQTTS